jgi:hypothetical protein
MNAFQQTQPLPLMNLFQILSRILFTFNFSAEWLVARSQSPIPPPPSLPPPKGPCRMDDMWTGKQCLVVFQSDS